MNIDPRYRCIEWRRSMTISYLGKDTQAASFKNLRQANHISPMSSAATMTMGTAQAVSMRSAKTSWPTMDPILANSSVTASAVDLMDGYSTYA